MPHVDTSSSSDSDEPRPKRRSCKGRYQPKVGTFVGVGFPGCTRIECTKQSVKFGTSYQKCHCLIKMVKGSQLLIHHVADAQLDDQWMDKSDERIVIDKDEQWCRHG